MPRVLIPPGAVSGNAITVTDPRELHHLLDVLRVKVGDRLECFDGQGRGYAGSIARCTARGLVVEIAERLEGIPRLLKVTLVQALIKPERFEWVIQKATELDVDTIIPLITERTIARPPPRHAEQKLTRWQRIAQAAAEQCGRTTLPQIETPRRFRDVIASLKTGVHALLPTLAVAAVSLKDELKTSNGATSVMVLIGPEGDFTREEALLAQGTGVRLVSLGRLTLRSETAAVAVLSILRHVLGDL